MLRSITDPYGRPVIKVTYGEMIFSLYRGCMGDDNSGRVVGVLACCIAHAWHTRVNTSVGSTYIIFWFSIYICIYIKTHVNIYVAVFKSIYSIKEYWWSLSSSWIDEVQRMFSTVHKFLNVTITPRTVFMSFIRFTWYFVIVDAQFCSGYLFRIF